jgi:hypothetical protein
MIECSGRIRIVLALDGLGADSFGRSVGKSFHFLISGPEYKTDEKLMSFNSLLNWDNRAA